LKIYSPFSPCLEKENSSYFCLELTKTEKGFMGFDCHLF
jgi:hypothetical protein